jgi:hypothetical protein
MAMHHRKAPGGDMDPRRRISPEHGETPEGLDKVHAEEPCVISNTVSKCLPDELIGKLERRISHNCVITGTPVIRQIILKDSPRPSIVHDVLPIDNMPMRGENIQDGPRATSRIDDMLREILKLEERLRRLRRSPITVISPFRVTAGNPRIMFENEEPGALPDMRPDRNWTLAEI